jgi:hypothetical protein
MKLTVKRSLGKLEHLNARVPSPLKQKLDALRVRAERLAIDYTATLVATLQEFATEFDEKLTAEERSAGIPQESPKNLHNGKDSERA